MKGLQKGLTASLMRSASFSSLRLTCYERISSFLSSSLSSSSLSSKVGQSKSNKLFPLLYFSKLFSGALAGAIAAFTCNPIEVVKVRLQSDNKNNKRYKNTPHAFFLIYKQEGVRGLWRGTLPHVQRTAVWAGFFLKLCFASF